MNALRVLASPRIWISIVGVVLVLALIFYAYLAAVASPQENLRDLPVALVNQDEGGEFGREQVTLGDQVVENVTGPDSPAGDVVEWAQLDSRQKATEGLGRNEYYGAIVIPENYTQQISSIASPPELTIAVVNEDEGAEMRGKRMELGEEVAKRITGPDSPAPAFIKWMQPDSRQTALVALSAGEAYAAIVIPKDYSKQLASMSGPPQGSQGPPPQGGEPPKPEPANLELLTSPVVRPATTGAIEDAFSGIVGGVSRATSERILGGLSEQGAPVPPASAVISDPVRGNVSEADVSTDVGPLPKAPKPAEIEVLTNPSSGPTAATPVMNISNGIVQGVSGATGERLAEAAGERGARLTPEVAAVIGNPVEAKVTEAEPVGDNSGNGQAPFFLAFLTNLAAFGGAVVIFFGVTGAVEGLASRNLRPSRAGLWTMMLLLGALYAALAAGAEITVAFGILGVEHEATTLQVMLFVGLAIAAIMAVVMLLMSLFGQAGIGIAAVFGILLGLVSAGGLAPIEALPGFYQSYADWLPLRYAIDGLRSLLFFDGRGAAGLDDAYRILAAYLAGSVILGYLASLVKDFLGSRRKGKKNTGEGTAETTG